MISKTFLQFLQFLLNEGSFRGLTKRKSQEKFIRRENHFGRGGELKEERINFA